MVKLVRLTSTNNAIFKGDMDSEIQLKDNAQVALHNLTFESDFTTLDVNENNDTVISQLDSSFNAVSYNLDNTQYKVSNYRDFFTNLGNALNGTLDIQQAVPLNGDVYSSFKTNRSTENGTRMIEWQTSPLSLMFHFNKAIKVNDSGSGVESALRGEFEDEERSLMYISTDDDGAASLLINTTIAGEANLMANIGNIVRNDAGATDELRYFVANIDKDTRLSDGSGIFGAYIHTLADNGDTSESNGFGIGLSYTDLSGLDAVNDIKEIPAGARDFEIIVEKPTDFYSYINPTTGAKTATTLLPFKIDGTSADNDYLILERRGGHIIASIWNTSVPNGLATVLFDYTLPNNAVSQHLYPYIYLKGGEEDVIVGRPMITYNSIFDANRQQDWIGNVQTLGGTNTLVGAEGFRTIFELMALQNWSNVVPVLDWKRTQVTSVDKVFELNLNNELLRYMGFSKSNYDGPGFSTLELPIIGDSLPLAYGWVKDADNIFELINSDSYVVELLNIALESYDASVPLKYSESNRGKRRNILEVIPVNNSTGIVEYNANEALYIDIKNANPLTITNIEIRILNKDLKPIETVGMSVITVIFKD